MLAGFSKIYSDAIFSDGAGAGTGRPPSPAAHPWDPAGSTSRKSKYTRGMQLGKEERDISVQTTWLSTEKFPVYRTAAGTERAGPAGGTSAARGQARPACSINLLSLVKSKQLPREGLASSQDTSLSEAPSTGLPWQSSG